MYVNEYMEFQVFIGTITSHEKTTAMEIYIEIADCGSDQLLDVVKFQLTTP